MHQNDMCEFLKLSLKELFFFGQSMQILKRNLKRFEKLFRIVTTRPVSRRSGDNAGGEGGWEAFKSSHQLQHSSDSQHSNSNQPKSPSPKARSILI